MRAVSRMGGLVGDLLSLARMEDTDTGLFIEKLDLSGIITETVCEMEPAALEKGLSIDRQIEPDITLDSDKEHILKIVSVYIDNAIKYTDGGGKVEVSLQRDKREIVLSVRNTGDGIPKDDLDKVFDRFYRSDPSRSSESGDFGLGLAIAKAAAERIGAVLQVSSEPGEYTEFRLAI